MNDEEVLSLFYGLGRIMRENGMGWAVDQVEEQINMSPQQRNTSINSPPNTYTVREQVELLLRAAEFVIVDTAQMEEEINNLFSRGRDNDSAYRQQNIHLNDNIFRYPMDVDLFELEQDRARAFVISLADMRTRMQERSDHAARSQAIIDRIRNSMR